MFLAKHRIDWCLGFGIFISSTSSSLHSSPFLEHAMCCATARDTSFLSSSYTEFQVFIPHAALMQSRKNQVFRKAQSIVVVQRMNIPCNLLSPTTIFIRPLRPSTTNSNHDDPIRGLPCNARTINCLLPPRDRIMIERRVALRVS